MQTITEDLLKELKNTTDISAFLNRHESEFIKETVGSLLTYMINQKCMTVAEVSKCSGVGDYLYKILHDTRKPSRDVLIAVALGMELSLEEIQLLLRVSKLAALDSRDKRDSIIIYGIVNHLSVYDTDDMLEQNGFTTIN